MFFEKRITEGIALQKKKGLRSVIVVRVFKVEGKDSKSCTVAGEKRSPRSGKITIIKNLQCGSAFAFEAPWIEVIKASIRKSLAHAGKVWFYG